MGEEMLTLNGRIQEEKTQTGCEFKIEDSHQEICNGSEIDWSIPAGWLYFI